MDGEQLMVSTALVATLWSLLFPQTVYEVVSTPESLTVDTTLGNPLGIPTWMLFKPPTAAVQRKCL